MCYQLVQFGACTSINTFNGDRIQLDQLETLSAIPRSMRRKMGRLTQLMFAAVSDAIRGLDIPETYPLVVGTAYGEVDMGISVLSDIFESGGALLRPVQVQNSVHVAASGYLGILLKNRGPTLTISHGKLTAEASLDALITLMHIHDSPCGVFVVGDLFDPRWAVQLKDKAPIQYERLTSVPYYEGAVALVVGRLKNLLPKKRLLNGGVFRFPIGSQKMKSWFQEFEQNFPSDLNIISRTIAPWDSELSDILAPYNHISAGPSYGTSLTGPLDYLISAISQNPSQNYFFMAREKEEIGFLLCASYEL